jgi:hypothetical protein
MKITCPACSFARDVDEGKLPPAAAIATCPRCRERFRFREPAASGPYEAPARSSAVQEAAAHPTPDDGAPPPGAASPPRAHKLPDEDTFSHPRSQGAPGSPSVPPEEKDGQESRRQAAEAYRRAAELPPHPEGQELSNPWEDPQDGYFAAFHQTSLRVLFAAPRFFAGLAPQKHLARALLFYMIVGLIQIAAEQVWLEVFAEALAPRAESEPQVAQLFTLLSGEMSLPLFVLARSAFISLQLFTVAALYHVVFRIIVPDRADYSLTFQVIAYASAPALLGIVPVLGSLVGFVWSIACSIAGCRYALRISWRQTLLALGPLYLVAIFLFLQLSVAARSM